MELEVGGSLRVIPDGELESVKPGSALLVGLIVELLPIDQEDVEDVDRPPAVVDGFLGTLRERWDSSSPTEVLQVLPVGRSLTVDDEGLGSRPLDVFLELR